MSPAFVKALESVRTLAPQDNEPVTGSPEKPTALCSIRCGVALMQDIVDTLLWLMLSVVMLPVCWVRHATRK